MSSKPLMSALRPAIDCFPPELLSIVAGYGTEAPHTWSAETVPKTVLVDGNRFTATDRSIWNRIVSTKTIADGSNRWSIRFTARPPAWLLLGITVATGNRQSNNGFYTDAATGDDFLISAMHAGQFGRIPQSVRYFHRGLYPSGSFNRKFMEADESCSASIEVDRSRRRLRFQFEDDNGTIQDLSVAIPSGLGNRPDDWRPCAVICGETTATIDDWTDPPVNNTFDVDIDW